MTTIISFKLAKLLKEKGFKNAIQYDGIGGYFTTITIATVIMWFYKKYGIWIANNWQSGSKTFLYELIDLNSYENTILIQEKNYKDVGEAEFKSPSEAYEAAIEYTLNNLI